VDEIEFQCCLPGYEISDDHLIRSKLTGNVNGVNKAIGYIRMKMAINYWVMRSVRWRVLCRREEHTEGVEKAWKEKEVSQI